MVQPEVTIEQGTLRGSSGQDIQGNQFYKFQGIPYAKPPLGELRFKAPVSPDKWTGILDATKEGDVCYSKDFFKKGLLSGSENCLFLNVYTKKVPNDENTGLSPVLFWIHGGGFVWGSGNEDLYGPDFLITEDIVLVTINYRLGLLGFVSFEDAFLDVPGNAGLKDQVMALKWVQKNIRKFGGDPNNVTIFGESAGGASVHLLMLSPMGKGLFHKAIAQSGCALTAGIQSEQGSKLLAKVLDLEGTDDKTVYNTLMAKPVEEIFKIQQKIMAKKVLPGLRPIGFVVEKISKEPFLPEEPIKLILSGNLNHVPFMLGYNTAEGLLFELFKTPNTSEVPNFDQMVPWNFGYEYGTPEQLAVADKIKKFYFGDEEYSSKAVVKKIQMLSDCYFVHKISVTALAQSKISKAPTYLYRMSIETELNFFKKLLRIDLPGKLKFLIFLFKHTSTPEIKPGSTEDISVRRFVKLWTNFAKFANPTPDENDTLLKATWKPVTGTNLDFLDIGTDLVPSSNPDSERINFWKSLFAESPAGKKLEVFV